MTIGVAEGPLHRRRDDGTGAEVALRPSAEPVARIGGGASTWRDGGGRGGIPPASGTFRFAVAFVLVIGLFAGAYPFLPRRYESQASIVLQPTDQDGMGDRSLRNPMDESAIQSVLDTVASPAVADAVIAGNHLEDDPEFGAFSARLDPIRLRLAAIPGLSGLAPPVRLPSAPAEIRRGLLEHLQVNRDRRSYTIRMGYWSSSPEKSAALTNSLLAAYLSAQGERKRTAAEGLTARIERRVAVLSGRYDTSRRAVEAFMASSGLVDSGAQVALDQRLQILGTEAAQARARYIEASVRAGKLTDMAAAGTLGSAPEVLGAPAVLKLKEGLASALSRTAVWSSETKAIEDQVILESQRIVSSAKVDADAWSARETLLQDEIAKVRAETTRRREAEQQLAELRRAADSDRAVLEESLTRLKGLTGRAEAAAPDAEVLSEGEVAMSAAFPRPGMMILAALMAASLAGLWTVRRPALAAARRLASA